MCRVSHEARERLLAFGDKYLSNIPRLGDMHQNTYYKQSTLSPNYVVKMKTWAHLLLSLRVCHSSKGYRRFEWILWKNFFLRSLVFHIRYRSAINSANTSLWVLTHESRCKEKTNLQSHCTHFLRVRVCVARISIECAGSVLGHNSLNVSKTGSRPK